MKKSFTLAILLVLTLSSCDLQKKEETKTNSGKVEINDISIDKDTSSGSIENSGSVENSGTGNLENNQKEQTMRKLQNGDVVAIITTNKGKIELFLDTKNAPITTANFIGLAKKGYYNGVIFHRVIKDFMIQGGDPDGTGMGGESIYGDKFADEFSSELKNNKFTISMANAGPDTNGSQFFINVNDNNFLDGKHSVFGEVVSGADNILNISKLKTDESDKPEKEVKIISVEIKQYKDSKFIDYNFSEEQAKKDYKDYVSNLDKKREEEAKKRIEAKKDMVLEVGKTATIDFTLKNEDGTEVLKTTQQLPIMEKVEILSGLQEGLKGMKIGEKKTLKLSPKEGYGDYRKDLEKEVKKSELKDFEDNGIKLEVGAELPTAMGVFKILEVKDDSVIVDMNNPFAGKTMIFDIEVKDIN